MAGISFELKKILAEKKLTSLFKAFTYSAFLSSGSWVISIVSIILVSFVASGLVKNKAVVAEFQVSITYLIALSLIESGFFQYIYTRFVADTIFKKKYNNILPGFFLIILLNMLIGFIICIPLALYLFKNEPAVYTAIFIFSFVILCGLWIINALLTGLKNFNFILYSFILGYLIIILLILFLARFGLEGLMLAFFTGQSVIFILMTVLIINNFPSRKLISFEFFKKGNAYLSLAFTGFFYNAGIWADKFVFWLNPYTSSQVFGRLRDSVIYDVPIFLAYLSMVPGMAVFFIKIEGEFAEYYSIYYEAILRGDTFKKISSAGNAMIFSARDAFFDVLRIQAIADIIIFLIDRSLFRLFGISYIYLPLFHILLLGTLLQLMLFVLICFLFYFDRKKESLFITFIFFLLNTVFSIISIYLGPYYYGYGYVYSLLISIVVSIIFLRRFLNEINYHTFMRF